MIGVLKFEWERIFTRKNVILFLLILLISLYFVLLGISDYKKVIENKKNFSELEDQKVSQFLNYEQYGTVGFRVMFVHSPLVIFFRNSTVLGDIEGNVDASEIIKIYELQKGQKVFNRKGNFCDFKSIIFIFGTLMMLYMGVMTFRSKALSVFFRKGSHIKIIASRLIWLDILLAIFFTICYIMAMLMGITFSDTDFNTFLYFAIVSIIFLDLFFLIGVLSAALTRRKKVSTILLLIFWVVINFVLPEIVYTDIERRAQHFPSLEKLNLEKQKILFDWEREVREKFLNTVRSKKLSYEEARKFAFDLHSEFLKNGYVENNEKETKLHQEVEKLAQTLQNLSQFFPGNHYQFLSGEVSGAGYNEYARFVNYILDLRNRFIEYYSFKRYKSDDKEVEPFIKGEENIFKAESRLPDNFGTGVLLTLLYGVIVFGVVLLVLHYRLQDRLKGERVEFELEALSRKRMYFVLCKNVEIRERLFKQVSEEPGVLAVDRIEGEDIDLELKPRHLLDYLCHIKGVTDREKVLRYLDELGGSDMLEKKKNETEPEDLKKIYLAVRLADDDKETILVNKYVTGATRSFEQKFIGVLKNLAAQNKRALYLSEEYYANLGITDVTERVKIKSGGVVSINITKIAVSLR